MSCGTIMFKVIPVSAPPVSSQKMVRTHSNSMVYNNPSYYSVLDKGSVFRLFHSADDLKWRVGKGTQQREWGHHAIKMLHQE
jgi:hypothetical protein